MSTPENDRKLLPIGPMAARIGVQPRELRAEADAGSLPCVRVGERGLLFDPDRVFAALAERAARSTPPTSNASAGAEEAKQ